MTPPAKLPRSLSALETWGFGLTGLLLWLGVAPAMQLDLGPQVLWVWLPGIVIGVLINLQVQRLGRTWPDVAGGTPNYIGRLFPDRPWLATYAALGYYLSWVAVLPVNAIVLTDLVRANLEPFGLSCPALVLKVGFTAIAFMVALTGTRALGILHLFFVVPAIALLGLFCIQGVGWLTVVGPVQWSFAGGQLALGDWAKWYIIASYAVYACETGSAFVADSRHPERTLRVLPVAAALIPLVYWVGSGVLLGLIDPAVGATTPYEQLLAATPFWGRWAAFIVTFLLASGSLLSCATAVSNTPRMLYQLALDGQLPVRFAQVSAQEVLRPGLWVTLALSLACLLWGDIAQIVLVTGIGWLGSFAIFHWGLWRQRHQPYIRWPWWSLGFALLEGAVVLAGGWAWNGWDLLLGLALPGLAWAFVWGVGQWPERMPAAQNRSVVFDRHPDLVLGQIVGLIGLLTGAIALSWFAHGAVGALPVENQINLLVVVILVGASAGVAIASWTMLPKVTAIATARQQAASFFNLAADGILVLDGERNILQANQASSQFLGAPVERLQGTPLAAQLPDLPQIPDDSQPLIAHFSNQVLEITLSQADIDGNGDKRYVAIMRDITQRQAAEAALREQTIELQQLLDKLTRTQSNLIQAEKMSGLGQLMAGVAHEINNPVSFIAGNVDFAETYARDLLDLIDAYRATYPNPPQPLVEQIKAIELDFLEKDFLQLLGSMKDGAQRITDIVGSLRTFSRQEETPTPGIDLHPGIESTLLILGNRLKAQGDRPEITIQRQFADLPPLECYPSALNQVFMNLLVNAIDALETASEDNPTFTPTIVIGTQPASHQDRPGVEITLTDNGPGIPESQISRIFDPFFTTKPIGKGTGLGLSISYQVVVERHQGSFALESEVGQGTRFRIWLPLVLSETAPTQSAAA
ncbi:MAG: amino acid permease [Leptolyngbya sp. RL_3_1]|nr:amino acid permease [Leptolyngbya sp. RL_3_1]